MSAITSGLLKYACNDGILCVPEDAFPARHRFDLTEWSCLCLFSVEPASAAEAVPASRFERSSSTNLKVAMQLKSRRTTKGEHDMDVL